MRDLLRGVLIAGGGSSIGIVLWIGVMKIIALVAGPAGVGTFSMLRQLQQVAATGAQLNGQAAIIQGLASRDAAGGAVYWREVRRILGWSLAVVSALVLLLAPFISRGMGGALDAGMVRGIVPAVVLLVLLNVATALLGARRELTWIAAVQGASGLGALALALPAARALARGDALLAHACLAGAAAAGLVVAVVALRKAGALPVAPTVAAAARDEARAHGARRDFLRLTGALFISGGIVAATPLVVRALLARSQGLDAVGHFDAAWTVGVSLVMLMLASIHAYYLPTLSAATDDAERRVLVDRFFRFASLAVVPALALVQAVKPWLVRLFYSGAFEPALPLLRWLLLGDLALVGAWILGLPLLVYQRKRAYVQLQVAWSVAFVAAVALVRQHAAWAEGVGIAFTVTYLALFLASAVVVGRSFGMSRGLAGAVLKWWLPAAVVLVLVALAVEGPAALRLTSVGDI